MGPIGWPELLLLLVAVVLIFGTTRIAGLGKASGRAIREFKEETRGLNANKQANTAQNPLFPIQDLAVLSVAGSGRDLLGQGRGHAAVGLPDDVDIEAVRIRRLVTGTDADVKGSADDGGGRIEGTPTERLNRLKAARG